MVVVSVYRDFKLKSAMIVNLKIHQRIHLFYLFSCSINIFDIMLQGPRCFALEEMWAKSRL